MRLDRVTDPLVGIFVAPYGAQTRAGHLCELEMGNDPALYSHLQHIVYQPRHRGLFKKATRAEASSHLSSFGQIADATRSKPTQDVQSHLWAKRSCRVPGYKPSQTLSAPKYISVLCRVYARLLRDGRSRIYITVLQNGLYLKKSCLIFFSYCIKMLIH